MQGDKGRRVDGEDIVKWRGYDLILIGQVVSQTSDMILIMTSDGTQVEGKTM